VINSADVVKPCFQGSSSTRWKVDMCVSLLISGARNSWRLIMERSKR